MSTHRLVCAGLPRPSFTNLVCDRETTRMQGRNFIIELKPPTNPNNIEKFYEKTKNLITTTGRVSLASKPFCQSVAGFDQSHNLASYLLERHPKLEILFHVTCYDLNLVNIRSRLASLKHLNIKRLLVISGDSYRQAEEPKLRALEFANSHELATCILEHYNWFDSIGVAGYPGGNGLKSFNNQDEIERVSAVLKAGVTEVYTQCVFDLQTFSDFNRLIKLNFPRVRVVPSVAVFESSIDINKIELLTRVHGASFRVLKNQIDQMSLDDSKEFSSEYLLEMCTRLFDETERIDLCTFGQFYRVQNLLDSISCRTLMNSTHARN